MEVKQEIHEPDGASSFSSFSGIRRRTASDADSQQADARLNASNSAVQSHSIGSGIGIQANNIVLGAGHIKNELVTEVNLTNDCPLANSPDKHGGDYSLSDTPFFIKKEVESDSEIETADDGLAVRVMCEKNEEGYSSIKKEVEEDTEIEREGGLTLRRGDEEQNILESCPIITCRVKHEKEIDKCGEIADNVLTVDWTTGEFEAGNKKKSVGSFSCKICSKTFRLEQRLDDHHSLKHLGIKPYGCQQCGKRFTAEQSLKLHSQIHTGKKAFSCGTCGRLFLRKAHLDEHVLTHSAVKPYPCTVCSRSFRRKQHLTDHMSKHTGELPYECSECDRAFTSRSQLTHHMRSHTGETFKCETCGKCLLSKYSLNLHGKQHEGNEYPCKQCKKIFKCYHSLEQHQIRQHINTPTAKLYPCKECSKMFKRSSQLYIHTFTTHNNRQMREDSKVDASDLLVLTARLEKALLHACEHCGKTFSKRLELVLHSQEHASNNAHSCFYCGETFTDAPSWKIHMRFHEGDSKVPLPGKKKMFDKELSCRVCGEAFERRSSLVSHEICVHSL